MKKIFCFVFFLALMLCACAEKELPAETTADESEEGIAAFNQWKAEQDAKKKEQSKVA